MTHPSIHAQTHPDKPAYIMAGSGETVTYGQLEARSNQGAHLFRSLGLKAGDHIALFLDNHPRFFDLFHAAVWQSAMVLIGLAMFMFWSWKFAPRPAAQRS